MEESKWVIWTKKFCLQLGGVENIWEGGFQRWVIIFAQCIGMVRMYSYFDSSKDKKAEEEIFRDYLKGRNGWKLN